MPGRVTYRERAAPTQLVLHGPAGPVGRMIERVRIDLDRQARVVTAERVNRRTGAYERGFSSDVSDTPRGPRARLSNSSDHAGILEAGSRPHIIRPRRPGGVLVFPGWGGQLVFARQVHHPGTRPYRILDTALRRVMRAYGGGL